MDKEKFDDYWDNRYLDQVSWYDKKSISEQRRYKNLQWSLIILSALTPALIEFQGIFLEVSGALRIATFSSVAVAILSAALKTFKYQENWVNYRTTCEMLKKEEHYFSARIDEYAAVRGDDGAARALFVERVESLISRENTLWVSTHKVKRSNGAKPSAG